MLISNARVQEWQAYVSSVKDFTRLIVEKTGRHMDLWRAHCRVLEGAYDNRFMINE